MVEEPVLSMRFSDGQWLRATYADVGGGGALILHVLPDDPVSLAPSRQGFGDMMTRDMALEHGLDSRARHVPAE